MTVESPKGGEFEGRGPLKEEATLLTDWGQGGILVRGPGISPCLESSEVPFSNVVVPPQVKAFVTQDIPL